jgi:hypothetical protein
VALHLAYSQRQDNYLSMDDLTSVYSRGAAACYRTDVKGRRRGDPFGPHDGAWIEVASLLEHATHVDDDAAAVLIRDAVELAESIVGDSENSIYCGPVPAPRGERGSVESIQLLTQELEEAGAHSLAALMLESLAAANKSMSVVELGRITAQRARIMWRKGGVEGARALYRRIRRMGRESGEVELEIRARLGFTTLAHVARDFAGMRRWGAACARLADRHAYATLARGGYHALLVAAATAEEYNEALLHAGRIIELSGTNSVALTEVLLNVGQLLYSAGHPEPGRAAFSAILSKTQPARIGLHALGGFALASSALGDRAAVAWVFAELQRQGPGANAPLPASSAFSECAIALLTVGDVESAKIAKQTALEIATRHGFHALIEKASAIEISLQPATPAPCVLTPKASVVARRIGSLPASRFPFQVSLIAAA